MKNYRSIILTVLLVVLIAGGFKIAGLMLDKKKYTTESSKKIDSKDSALKSRQDKSLTDDNTHANNKATIDSDKGKDQIDQKNEREKRTEDLGKNAIYTKDNVLNFRPNDITIGDKNAKVTMIEYTSITCPHCKSFHETSLGQIRQNFIENNDKSKNKLFYIMRDLPTDPISFRIALIIENLKVDNNKKILLKDALFVAQNDILKEIFDNKNNPKLALKKAMEKIYNIMYLGTNVSTKVLERYADVESKANEQIIANIISEIDALSKYSNKNIGAPTFILNGNVIEGARSADKWIKDIEELIRYTQSD